MSLTVAILGRPNVGKSTLFNRLVGKRQALVDDAPGVTRDRRLGEGRIADLSFQVFDTAGLEEGSDNSLTERMRAQTERAVEDSDVVLFLIDAKSGVTPMDQHFANWLRRSPRPVVLVANKCDSKAAESGLWEAYSLGCGAPVEMSAEHGDGLSELYGILREHADRLAPAEDGDQGADPTDTGDQHLPEEGDLEFAFQDRGFDPSKPLQLAVVGRPNAGKSTLVNQLVAEERVITGPEAGITRDAIAVEWEFEDRPIRLIDTAGLRRRSRVQEKLEKLSVADTLRAVQFSEVVILIIDATLGIERQDLRIAEHVVDEGRALVIALNKWDLVTDRLALKRTLEQQVDRTITRAKGVALVPLSALTGQGIRQLMPAVLDTYEDWNARIPTAGFNRWLAEVQDHHPAPMAAGRRIKLRYGAQIKTRPPTFLLFANKPEDLPPSYLKYLENEMRREFDLPGVPLRFHTRKSKNPYHRGRRRKKRA